MTLRNRMKQRLSSVRGDTLVEAMAALLIAALGASALATMVMASVNVSAKSQQSLDALYQAERTMALSSTSGLVATISIPAQDKGSAASASVSCELYQGLENGDPIFMRYEKILKSEPAQD